jgi:DNA recombination protein RmuC
MPESTVLTIAILASAALGGFVAWVLSNRAARLLGATATEADANRLVLERQLAEQTAVLRTCETDLAGVRSELQQTRDRTETLVEERARLDALLQAEQRLTAERADAITRVQQVVSAIESDRDRARDRAAALETELASARTALDEQRNSHAESADRADSLARELRTALAEVNEAHDTERMRRSQLEAELASLTTRLAQEQKAYEERLQTYQDAESRVKDAVKVTAAEALRANNEAFLTLAEAKLGDFQHRATADFEQKHRAVHEVVAPVASLLERLKSDLQTAEQNRVETRTEILAQVRNVATLVPTLQRETAQLARALRQSGTRGRWGELQLRRSLELAGLVEGQHYTYQPPLHTDEGRLIPDVIVHLPGNGHIVIDAKSPMQAFLEAHAADADDEKEARLAQHVAAVRQHAIRLGAKDYASQVNPSPDFVVMYVPVEAALSEALMRDSTLMEDAAHKNVVLAGPLVLIALLRAVGLGWRQHQVAERAEEIAAAGAELHNRIAVFVEHLCRLGNRLEGGVEAYNEAVASLQTRLVPKARELEALHVKATKRVRPLQPVDTRPRLIARAEVTAAVVAVDAVHLEPERTGSDARLESGSDFAAVEAETTVQEGGPAALTTVVSNALPM